MIIINRGYWMARHWWNGILWFHLFIFLRRLIFNCAVIIIIMGIFALLNTGHRLQELGQLELAIIKVVWGSSSLGESRRIYWLLPLIMISHPPPHLLLVVTSPTDTSCIPSYGIRLHSLRHSHWTECASPASQLVRRWSPVGWGDRKGKPY